MTPETLLAALRLLHAVAAMLLWGAGAYLLLVPIGLARRTRDRLEWVFVVAIGVCVATTALRLPVTAASYGDGWSSAFDRGTVHAVLLSRTGTAWKLEAVAAGALLWAALRFRASLQALAIGAAVLLGVSAFAGHAAREPGWLGVAHLGTAALHVLASGFWLGALVPLAAILRHEGAAPAGLVAIRRFAVAGQIAVALALATGIANVLLARGGPGDWRTLYGALLLAKVALVAAMIAIALANHFRLLPAMARGSNRAAQAIRRGAIAEIGLGVGAVALVSVFGMLDPA